jgi:two-component system sensor histidine kinase TctE
VLLGWAEGFDSLVPDPLRFLSDIDIPAGTRRAIDQVMLKEALSNLISNAVVHGGTGLTRVSLAAHLTDGQIVLSVEDDGIGIPQQDVDTALTRFAQVGNGEGSGLGLSIARAIAEAHGGTLYLERGSAGLRAVIALPL